ncbi:MAG: thiosulfate oxidation carrier protein SoxY [Methylococcaceae bacterium]|nr:thiosulfate oxidation carrier protein SoxY [Methylococcaceae bacterium]
MTRLFADRSISYNDRINLSLPKIAENGAVVPITISSELDAIDRVYILIERNPTPLAAVFELSSEAMVYLTARIKMAESCNVVVIVRQGERLFKAQQWVNVVMGGCGTG